MTQTISGVKTYAYGVNGWAARSATKLYDRERDALTSCIIAQKHTRSVYMHTHKLECISTGEIVFVCRCKRAARTHNIALNVNCRACPFGGISEVIMWCFRVAIHTWSETKGNKIWQLTHPAAKISEIDIVINEARAVKNSKRTRTEWFCLCCRLHIFNPVMTILFNCQKVS